MSSARLHAAPRSGRTWAQRMVISLGALAVVFCLTAAAALGYGVWKYEQITRVDVAVPAAAAGAPQNYLLVGSDSRAGIDPESSDAAVFLSGETDGLRTDTMLIARVDPGRRTVDVVSLPRDLWVPIAGTDGSQRLNTAIQGGEQRLIDTIQENFGIPIHHYIEVDFVGFQQLVDTVGGVPLWFDTPMRDDNSGLDVASGCVRLTGRQALAFVRARHLRYQDEDGDWRADPTGDLGRISRQHVFLEKALEKSVTIDWTDVGRINGILDVAIDSVKLDQALGVDELRDLGERFSAGSGDRVRTWTLPVTGFRTSGGAAVLDLDEAAAQKIFNVFNGLPYARLVPADVQVAVRNGSGVGGQAASVGSALEQLGFSLLDVGDADRTQPGFDPARTTVRYAPGRYKDADLLRRHLTSGATLVEDQSAGAAVVLVTGTDFSTIRKTPSIELPTTGAGGGPTTTSGSTSTPVPDATTGTTTDTTTGTTGTDSTAATGTTDTTGVESTTTTIVGQTPGEAPPGETCS